MNLSDIVRVLREHDLVAQAPERDVAITRVDVDSRAIVPGALFIAVRGAMADGHKFIPQALAGGASALIAEVPVETAVPVVVVRDGKRAAQLIAEAWYDHPARLLDIVAITGTNGKTTTTAMMRHLLNAAGDAGSIGTLGAFGGTGERVDSSAGSLTTPGPLDLQATFRALVDRGARHVAMEASSHALDQGRLDGVTFRAGVFTNLTREHLDYHGTMEHYLAAKLRLADLVATDGVLSINADDPAWHPLVADRRAVTWGSAPGSDVTVAHPVFNAAGSRFTLGGRFGNRDVAIPFLGEFNVANAVGAATAALGGGMPLDVVVERLATAPQVPGRMERVADAPFTVLRDYMHTPDAFERVLAMLRPLVPGKLYIVFGCGGDRDKGKRPIMGRLAAQGTDRVILTSDNPRHEDPERIIDDIVTEMPPESYDRILDREAAIAHALTLAQPGDTVLLAGKGHETYQVEGSTYRHFDEREIVRSLLA
ncbi:MAG TPA: UDP-N-acetylmuramoyl-L-alanyl-D-glutamate--2,6-diaminopimelate ligase [Gemmatimonadales bacterium]